MKKFLYVFTEHDRDILLTMQYNLLKSDKASGVYIFISPDDEQIIPPDVQYVQSDTLTF